MTAPGFVAIRVGYMTPRLPYPVNLHMPPIGVYNHRVPRTVGPELDIVVPDDDSRHTTLGIFLDTWSHLEWTLHQLLARLLKIEVSEAEMTVSRLGGKNTIDLLDALGLRKLEPDDAKKLTLLTTRLGKLNAKRNVLVHGHWVYEANVITSKGEARLLTQFLRVTRPIDPDDEKAMANPRNQKERVRYSFTIKRISGTTREADALRKDIHALWREMAFKLPDPMQQLIDSRPYRVTYQSS